MKPENRFAVEKKNNRNRDSSQDHHLLRQPLLFSVLFTSLFSSTEYFGLHDDERRIKEKIGIGDFYSRLRIRMFSYFTTIICPQQISLRVTIFSRRIHKNIPSHCEPHSVFVCICRRLFFSFRYISRSISVISIDGFVISPFISSKFNSTKDNRMSFEIKCCFGCVAERSSRCTTWSLILVYNYL